MICLILEMMFQKKLLCIQGVHNLLIRFLNINLCNKSIRTYMYPFVCVLVIIIYIASNFTSKRTVNLLSGEEHLVRRHYICGNPFVYFIY